VADLTYPTVAFELDGIFVFFKYIGHSSLLLTCLTAALAIPAARMSNNLLTYPSIESHHRKFVYSSGQFTAIYSIEHGPRTLTAVFKSNESSFLRGIIK